ncbi:hypothetical protein CERSUDRAFT_88950 [Gelatoporia subvermispora B]|uniref:DUF6534 domain-containing protein n=1 Tax=Ceriporiopsis subvermispora (strain B) TaxID=914234 RepID=M2R030_CERS8|nr:hypothetical protein CERSUDRAFT_88950 [Gelatoporia subvermispora B]
MSLHFDGTLGAAFLGHFVTAVLFGITSLQTWIYFRQHHKDPLFLRSLVFFLWILDALHVGLITGGMYSYLITHFGDVIAIAKPSWSILTMIIVTVSTLRISARFDVNSRPQNISNIIVRGVFSYRLWKLSGRSKLVPIAIGILSLYTAGDAFYFAVRGLSVPSYFLFHQFSWSLYAGFGCEVVTDSIITVSQCLILWRFRTGIESTDSVIYVLVTYSINTCLLTSICAMLCLITFVLLPDMFVYFAFYFILGKLYVNSLLANMNARGSLLQNLNRPVHSLSSKAMLTGASSTSKGHIDFRPISDQFTTVIDPTSPTTATNGTSEYAV